MARPTNLTGTNIVGYLQLQLRFLDRGPAEMNPRRVVDVSHPESSQKSTAFDLFVSRTTGLHNRDVVVMLILQRVRRSPPRGPWLASGRRHPSVLQKRCGWRRAFDHRVIHNWRLCSSLLYSSGSLFLAAKEGIPSASMAPPDVSHSIMGRIIGRWFVCAVASRASRVPIGPGTTRPHGSPGTMSPSSPIDQIEIQPARTWATCQKGRLRLSDTSKHSNRGVS